MTDPIRPAAPADVRDIIALVEEYYRHEGYPFDAAELTGVVARLIDNPSRGLLWVIEPEDRIVGYCVLTWGYSLEHRGQDAFIDELYVAPAYRSHGLGAAALQAAECACRAAGVRSLHLEVERINVRAQELYRRLGFVDHDRYLMTKPIAPATTI